MRRIILALFVTVLMATLLAVALLAENEQTYGGVGNCKMCHPDVYKDWQKTSHSRGFDLLVNVGEEKNPKCLACHSTGYGKGGFVDAATTPELEGITCEACHGPGADHMGDKTKIQRVPAAGVCAACHQKANLHAITE